MEKASSETSYNMDLTDQNLLGEGAYGWVYKIQRKNDGLMCAAKLFKVPIDVMDNIEQLSYERESQILKQVDNPFVI